MQLITVSDLLSGKGIDYPPEDARKDATFKQAPRSNPSKTRNFELPLD
jgi:hypothetical protein